MKIPFLKTIGIIGLWIPWPVRAAVFMAYSVALTWLLLAPAATIDRWYPHFQHVDKVLHFLSFGGLVLLARFAFPDPRHLAVPGWPSSPDICPVRFIRPPPHR